MWELVSSCFGFGNVHSFGTSLTGRKRCHAKHYRLVDGFEIRTRRICRRNSKGVRSLPGIAACLAGNPQTRHRYARTAELPQDLQRHTRALPCAASIGIVTETNLTHIRIVLAREFVSVAVALERDCPNLVHVSWTFFLIQ